jgi:hypothetical protein
MRVKPFATRAFASAVGAYAGCLGCAHGVYEVLQGNTTTDGLIIYAVGPPCRPEAVWHGCLPALSITPNFLMTGILAILVALAVTVWAAAFVGRRHGGLVLIALALGMLLVGGGFIPMMLGLIAGAVGTRIGTPLAWWRRRLRRRSLRLLGSMWPSPLVVYFLWIAAQFPLGLLANQLMTAVAGLSLPLEFALLAFCAIVAFASDIRRTAGSN